MKTYQTTMKTVTKIENPLQFSPGDIRIFTLKSYVYAQSF